MTTWSASAQTADNGSLTTTSDRRYAHSGQSSSGLASALRCPSVASRHSNPIGVARACPAHGRHDAPTSKVSLTLFIDSPWFSWRLHRLEGRMESWHTTGEPTP